MSISRTSRRVGAVRVRAHVRNGMPTGKWFVDIPRSVTGTRRKRKLFDNQRTALEVARELRRRLDPFTPSVQPQQEHSGLTFHQAAKLWQQDQELRVQTLKKRPSSLKVDCYRLKALVAFFGDDDIACITEAKLIEYQRCRLTQGRKPITINSQIGTFCYLMRWAKKHGYVSVVPTVEQIPVRRTETVIPTPEEVVRIIFALPERLQPLVRFLAETGCRPGEAFNLTWDSVDEVNGYVEIRSRDGWRPKTQQSERRIPINPSLLAMLRQLPKTGSYVFPGKVPNQPIDNFRKALNSAVLQADIRRRGKPVGITPKSFRKAHATWQAMNGVNESVLQGLLGHAPGSRVTKQAYVHATEEAKRQAVIRLPIPEHNRNEDAPSLATSGNTAKKERQGF